MSEPRYSVLHQTLSDERGGRGAVSYVLDSWNCYRECARFSGFGGGRVSATRRADELAARWNAEHAAWLADVDAEQKAAA